MLCAQCNHTIPDRVNFCAYCGAEIRQVARAITFPQGESASDLPGLAACCQRHWDYARDILHDGTLEEWLRTAQFNPIAANRAREIVANERNRDLRLDRLLRELVPGFPPPQVAVHPASLSGGDIPWQQQRLLNFEIHNSGAGCLVGQVRSHAAWLTVQPTEVSCLSGHTVQVQITLSAAKLDPGQQYRGMIEIQSGNGGQAGVPVTVTVPAPRLELTPATLDLGSGYQGERLTQPVTLHNRGGSAFEAEITSPARWLEAQPRTVHLEPGRSASVTIAADTSGMPVGAHTAQAQVTARAGAWQAQTAVPVAAALPQLKTLQYRWGTTLDYAAAGLVGMVVLLFAMRWLEISAGFWLGLAQAATWATLLGIGVGFYLAWRKKPAYRRYSGVGAIVVGCVAVIGLGYLWTQPTRRLSCYDQGIAFRESGDWQQSIAAFERCGDYCDALQQIPETYRQQAQVAITAQDWDIAVTAAAQLRVVDEAQGRALLSEACFGQAQAAMAAQDWDIAVTAAAQLRVVDEAQGRALLSEACFGQAQAAMAAQDWDIAVTAAVQLQAVDEAKGRALLSEAYSRQVQAAMAAQDWDIAVTAAVQLQAVDETQGRALLPEAYSGQAQAAIAAQDWAKAGIAATYLRGFDRERGAALWAELPPEAHAAVTQVRPADEMVQVYVPAGQFQMGSEDGTDYERPVHTVTLDGFWLDRTEVTNGQFSQCVQAGACKVPTFCYQGEPTYGEAGMDDHPVVCVDWHGAVAYCKWAGGRLPTEAEWEYAARGPEEYVYPWGDSGQEGYANCDEGDCKDGYDRTAPVGSFPAGASWVGAQDLAGNVSEWVSDSYGDYPSEAQTNPTGPSGNFKVLRGGSWLSLDGFVDSANRNKCSPTCSYYYFGFRCVSPPR